MKENKSPAFQFYVQDFLMGTLEFTAEQVGGYIRLLCHQWDKGGLPDDDKKLMQLSGMKAKALPEVKVKFMRNDDGQLRNVRMEKVRDEQQEYRQKQKERAEKRWNKTDATAMPRHDSGICQTDALQSSSSPSSSPSKVNTEKTVGDESPPPVKKVVTEKQPKKPLVEKEPSVYMRSMAVYCAWFEQRFETAAKIDGQQGKALKDLIAYFRPQVIKKFKEAPPDEKQIEDGVVSSFEVVFQSWDKLEVFYQQKTKLSEINSNIQNIIVQIKTPKQNGKQQQQQTDTTPIWRRTVENAG